MIHRLSADHRHFLTILSVQALLLFIMSATNPCLLLAKNFAAIKDSPSSTANDEQYKAAKDYYYRLERDEVLGQERKNWLRGVRKFRKIYLSQVKGPLAPSSLYMMGRMQYKLYQRFQHPIDLDDAIGYFTDVATIFPDNTLADDALFNTGEIYLQDKKNTSLAAERYHKIVNRYPDGDRYAKAINRLQQLGLEGKASGGSARGTKI